MDKNHLDEDFAKVGEFYVVYKNALLDKENNAAVIESTKQKIVGAFWKITQKVKSFSPEMKDNSLLIVKVITSCLKTYPDKDPVEFCKLTFGSIKKKLAGAASTSSFEEKTGMHITEDEDRKRKRIEKAYKQYASINKDDKYAFMDYAETYLGFQREELEIYLFPVRTSSLFVTDKNGEEFCLGDTDEAKNVLTSSNAASDYGEFECRLNVINEAWLKQKDDSKSLLSVAMTVDLLGDFSKSGSDEKIISLFRKQDFINKELFDSFISNKDFKLPTQTEIGEPFGLTKSAVSVRVTRFIKNIKK